MVECDLAKVEVAGSNPVSRSHLRAYLPNGELRLREARRWACSDLPTRYGRASTFAHACQRLRELRLASHAKVAFPMMFSSFVSPLVAVDRVNRRGRTFQVSFDPQFRPAPSPSGKAEVCKTSIPGSNPGGASTLRA